MGQIEQCCAEKLADHWGLLPHPLAFHHAEHDPELLPQAATPAGLRPIYSRYKAAGNCHYQEKAFLNVPEADTLQVPAVDRRPSLDQTA